MKYISPLKPLTLRRGFVHIAIFKNPWNMGYIRHNFDTYRIYHYNADHTANLGVVCSISCYSGARLRGILYFYEMNSSKMGSSYAQNGVLGLNFRENLLSDIINTLRYEKPLFIWYNNNDHSGGLDTSKEPVGEEESGH